LRPGRTWFAQGAFCSGQVATVSSLVTAHPQNVRACWQNVTGKGEYPAVG
jgi:hypothetical protein